MADAARVHTQIRSCRVFGILHFLYNSSSTYECTCCTAFASTDSPAVGGVSLSWHSSTAVQSVVWGAHFANTRREQAKEASGAKIHGLLPAFHRVIHAPRTAASWCTNILDILDSVIRLKRCNGVGAWPHLEELKPAARIRVGKQTHAVNSYRTHRALLKSCWMLLPVVLQC